MTEQHTQRQITGLSRLAQLEWEARQAESPVALAFSAVNDTHRLVPYRYALLWLAEERRITAVSDGLRVEPTAPQIVWFTRLAEARTGDRAQACKPANVPVDELPANLRREHAARVEGALVWVPLAGPCGSLAGGLVLVREKTASEAELRLLGRVGSAYGHAFLAHAAAARLGHRERGRGRQALLVLAAIAVVAGAIPIPLTVLADAKVVAAEPVIVSSRLDGVVERVEVRPNESVAVGRVLFRLDATELAAQREVAAKRVAVLTADSRRAEAEAFRDPKALAEIGSLRAKLAEGEADLAWARDRLARTEVRAGQGGIALLDDPSTWEGRPVKVGERIMAIADPRRLRLEIEVAPEDGLVAQRGAEVELFLAVAPSEPVAARIVRTSYEPRQLAGQRVAYVAEAELTDTSRLPRLGLTGTAKIYGERVPLAYALARKPLAALRRFMGL